MNEVRSSADLAIVNECWLRRWTPSRAARAILSFQPVLERIQYLYFIIFWLKKSKIWKKEWKLIGNIGSSKLNSPLSFFLFSLLSSFPFPFSFSLFFFCIIAPPAPKICPPRHLVCAGEEKKVFLKTFFETFSFQILIGINWNGYRVSSYWTLKVTYLNIV